MDLICMLWRAEPRGVLSYRMAQWQQLLRCTELELVTALDEFTTFTICDTAIDDHGFVMLSSRRIIKDEKSRESARISSARYREKKARHGEIRERHRKSHISEVISQNQKSESEGSAEGISEPPSASPKADEPVVFSIDDIRTRWNQILGVKLCKKIEGALAEKLRRLVKQQDAAWWEELFQEVARSRFLTGKIVSREGREPFRATLDWATGPINRGKILAGNYDDKTTQASSRGVM